MTKALTHTCSSCRQRRPLTRDYWKFSRHGKISVNAVCRVCETAKRALDVPFLTDIHQLLYSVGFTRREIATAFRVARKLCTPCSTRVYAAMSEATVPVKSRMLCGCKFCKPVLDKCFDKEGSMVMKRLFYYRPIVTIKPHEIERDRRTRERMSLYFGENFNRG